MTSPGSLNVTTPSDREIAMTRVFDAPRTLVFDAFTTPDLVKRWLLGPPGWSMPVCEIDLRPGGALRYRWRNEADGKEFGLAGTFREILAPERIVHTELFDEDWTGGETLVTTTFEERGGKTTVTMTVLYASKEARDKVLQTGMTEGVAQGFDRLAELLRSAAIGKPGQDRG
jgi:uncharacterized protein YndB with AHSA1/START domain